MNPKLLVAAAAGLLLVVIVAVIALAGGGGDDDDTAVASPTAGATVQPGTTPAPSPTLETAPTAAASPEATPGTPEEQARNLRLEPAPPGMLEFVTDGPYVVPGDRLGVFYLDIETRQIEGWYDLIGGNSPTLFAAFSADNRFSVFNRHQQSFAGGITYPAGDYLGDREARAVYSWQGDAELVFQKQGAQGSNIAARGDLVVFRIPSNEEGGDWFSLFDVSTGEVELVFQAEASWALISEDGTRIVLVGDAISVVDVSRGEVEAIVEDATGPVDLEGTNQLIDSPDGESFLFVSSPVKAGFTGVALRYTWEGELLSRVEGTRVFPSPRGDFVAVAEPIIAGPEDTMPWYVISAFDTADGTPLFRIVGVLPYYGFNAGNRWLADGSGLVVSRADYRLVLAMRDGSFRDFVGVPSPDSPDVFGVWGGAVDGEGDEIVVINFQGGIRDFMEVWGERGDEVRMVVPHLGHGGPPFIATIVEPSLEQTPYAAPPVLQLSADAVSIGLVTLYDSPGGQAIGQIPAPYRVSVLEVVRRCAEPNTFRDPERCPLIDSNLHADFFSLVVGTPAGEPPPVTGLWARVTAVGGPTGWMLLQVTGQGP